MNTRSVSNALVVQRSGTTVDELVGAFESETAAMFVRTAPVREHIMLYALIGTLIVGILFCATVKLDRVVTGTGRIVPTAGELYISPFDTGLVRRVSVKVGDIVKAGQSLATLDPTFTAADLRQLRQKLDSNEAAVARLESELSGQTYQYSRSDPYQALQGGIWLKRRAEYISNLADFDARIRSTDAQISQAKQDAQQYEKRLELASNVEKLYEPLLQKGYVSKLQSMQAKDNRTEIGRMLADSQNQTATLIEQLASLQAQRQAYIDKWHSDAGTELVNVRNELDVTRQLLKKASLLSELTTLNSPVDAVVLKIGKVSTGSVAGSGGQNAGSGQDPLFTLVPLNAPVEVDLRVPAGDIGFIKVADPVQMKLDAYRFLQHGTAKGKIKSISEGSFTTDDNNQPTDPYFKVRVAITNAHLRDVPPDFRLIPGMTLVGDILVGHRTILSYLVEGGLRTGSEAMREP